MKQNSDKAKRKRVDALFGQIALRLGIITQEQLEHALDLQRRADEQKPLGVILMGLDLVSEKDLARIIEAQKEVVSKATNRAKAIKEDNLFGKVAIRLSFVAENQIHECLTMQEQLPPDRFMRLGDIMVIKGYLTVEQVNKIVELQKGLILYCTSCDTQYNVVMFRPGSSLHCYQCGSALRVPVRQTSSRMDESIYFGEGE